MGLIHGIILAAQPEEAAQWGWGNIGYVWDKGEETVPRFPLFSPSVPLDSRDDCPFPLRKHTFFFLSQSIPPRHRQEALANTWT